MTSQAFCVRELMVSVVNAARMVVLSTQCFEKLRLTTLRNHARTTYNSTPSQKSNAKPFTWRKGENPHSKQKADDGEITNWDKSPQRIIT